MLGVTTSVGAVEAASAVSVKGIGLRVWALVPAAIAMRSVASGARPFLLLVLFFVTPGTIAQNAEGRKPTYLGAEIGESVVLNCEVDFPHDTVVPYSVRWNKEGSMAFAWNGDEQMDISPNFKGRVSRLHEDNTHLGRGAVNLTSIRESDQGWYECQVLFPNRNPPMRPNGTWFHLTVEGGKVMTIPPVNQTTLEGEDVRFKCVAKQPGARIVWYRDSVSLADIPDLWARSQVEKDGTLVILRTEHTDPGMFVCEVTNEAGEMQTAGAYLNVLYKAKVLSSPHEQYLIQGQAGLLDCNFRANPPLTYLRWEKDGYLYDPYNVPGVFLLHNGSLSFDHVDQSHSGEYTCTPFNDLGSSGESAPMKVIVQQPPIFSVRPASLYVRRIGNNVKMHCAAEPETFNNQNPLVVTWFKKDGSSLPQGRYFLESGNLTIRTLLPADSGIYICTVANEAASLTAEAELVVEESAQRAPHTLSVSSTEDSAQLKWISSGTRISQQILVWYRLMSGDVWRTLKVEHGAQEAYITPLLSGSLYEFMVSSRDPHEEGLMSKTIRIHTKGEKFEVVETVETVQEVQSQPDHVENSASDSGLSDVSLRAINAPSWILAWKDSSSDKRPNKYTVRWRPLKEEFTRERVIDTQENWILVNGLEEGDSYVFEVENKAGGPSVQKVAEVTASKMSSTRLLVLSVLVCIILLTAVAIASWHVGKSHGMREKERNTHAEPHSEPKSNRFANY